MQLADIKFTADIRHPNYDVVAYVPQYDNSYQFVITLTQNGLPFIPNFNGTYNNLIVRWTNEDGTTGSSTYATAGALSGNVLSLTLPEALSNVVGKTTVGIEMHSSNSSSGTPSSRLSILPFIVEIVKRPGPAS